MTQQTGCKAPAEPRVQPAGGPAESAQNGPAGASFVVRSRGATIVAQGCRQVLHTAPGRVAADAAHLLRHLSEGPRLLVGALPFDVAEAPHLYQPQALAPAEALRAASQSATPPSAPLPAGGWRLGERPSAGAYRNAVARALALIAAGAGDDAGELGDAGALSKVVLARGLDLEADRPIDIAALLRRLGADPAVTAFCVPLPADARMAAATATRHLVGASPELLVSRRGDRVTSHPLAGSARRLADSAADRASAEALLASEKDHREHGVVVEAILDMLAPLCRELGAPEGTTLASTLSMWHLGTRIEGRLKDPETSSLALAALLHPTPAVCGTPRAAAAAAIAALEPEPRGFYAGAVGWCDAAGEGDWWVAIRCADVCGSRARLFAGAGIVAGSDPVAETEETGAKFAALLAALGVPASALPPHDTPATARPAENT
ncbi:isochorismate synthase [Ancylobacter sp. 6x-1]|uniref:isochorismate synthase n=1 Tax=Ancylobacter crimeensis TaxID=2579147 RepID=A0ABT0DB95_9HYPH|nr:isochorismate synthase [Ancylobacter crimeensis]MCK0197228.1 isochorismate synthase [Ancylobacter crimeensis]